MLLFVHMVSDHKVSQMLCTINATLMMIFLFHRKHPNVCKGSRAIAWEPCTNKCRCSVYDTKHCKRLPQHILTFCKATVRSEDWLESHLAL